MSSKKHLPLEFHTQGRNKNSQKQSVLRHGTIPGASSSATMNDEKYYEYSSEEMREVENEGNEEIKKLKKSMEEYISEQIEKIENGEKEKVMKLKKNTEKYVSKQMEKIENGRIEEMMKMKKYMEEYVSEQIEKTANGRNEEIKKLQKCVEEHISEQMGKIENGRNEEIKKLQKCVEEFLNKDPQHMKDRKSQALRPEARQLRHKVIDRPLLNENEMTMDNQIPKDQCCGGSTRTKYGSGNVKMMLEDIPATRGHVAMEVAEQSVKHPLTQKDYVRIGSEITAKACYDFRIKTRADSSSGHTPLNSSHLSMEGIEQNTLEADSPRRLCVLLLGSSGNGKSSIGNSILGKDVFRTSSSVKSPTPCIAMDSAQVGDQTVQVVDGPSILDSKDADEDFLEQIVVAMEKSLTLCDYAFSAIVIVFRFGVRFTKQEVNTIKLVKSVLGENVIKDYGICAVSYGDNFEHAVEEASEDGQLLTFEGWCREQSGEVKALFEECNFRCVLFNNRTKDENTKNAQRLAFLKMVNPMKPYSKEEFLKAQTSLNKEIGTERLIHDLEEQTQKIIDNTRSGIQDLSEDSSLQHMDSLLQDLTDHQVILRELGMSSPKLRELIISMQLLETEIRSKMRKKSLVEDNMSLTTPLFKSNSSPTYLKSTFPSSTYGCFEQGLLSDEYARGMGTRSGNMGYTPPVNDWEMVQNESNPFPTVRGHRGVTASGWGKMLGYIWKSIMRYTTKRYPH